MQTITLPNGKVVEVQEYIPLPKPPPKAKTPKPKKRKLLPGETYASQYFVYAVFDLTTGILYVIGGFGYTQRLVTKLLRYKTPHRLHLFEGNNKNDIKFPWKLVSSGRRGGYGVRLDLDLPWKEMRVIRGSGIFHVMVHNHKGRKQRT